MNTGGMYTVKIDYGCQLFRVHSRLLLSCDVSSNTSLRYRTTIYDTCMYRLQDTRVNRTSAWKHILPFIRIFHKGHSTVPYKARLSTEIGKLRRFDVKIFDPVSDPDPPTLDPDPIVQKVPAPNLSKSTRKGYGRLETGANPFGTL